VRSEGKRQRLSFLDRISSSVADELVFGLLLWKRFEIRID